MTSDMNSPPSKRRRLCRRTDNNMFTEFLKSDGVRCFVDSAKIKKIRMRLYRDVRDMNGYRDVVKNIAQQALDFYDKYGSVLYIPDDTGRIRNFASGAILLALHLCQRSDYHDDPAMVKRLIRIVSDFDHGFDRFMMFLDPLSFSFEIDQTLYPMKPSESKMNSSRHVKALQYFLQYCSTLTVKMQFSEFDFAGHEGVNAINTYTGEVDMVNCPVLNSRGSTPLLLACHSLEPNSVLLLLRYGADPLRPGQMNHIIGLQFQHPLYVLVTKLNASVFWRSHNRHMGQDVHDRFLSRQNEQDRNLRLCLRYLCRAMTSLPISTKPLRVAAAANKSLFQLHRCFEDLLPKNRSTEPAELSQWCRCCIRKVLHKRGHMPAGIDKLPLPPVLKSYIDLMID